MIPVPNASSTARIRYRSGIDIGRIRLKLLLSAEWLMLGVGIEIDLGNGILNSMGKN
jgi:hypothetical protein